MSKSRTFRLIFDSMFDVAIIGGGLAGLINAILIQRAGFRVVLFEEKKYPFHRVCGEYISNEVIPFLKSQELYPQELDPAKITQFHLTSISGKSLEMPLDLGGFGISRYAYDSWLVSIAKESGVNVCEEERIEEVYLNGDQFDIKSRKRPYQARTVIGAFGKRSKLDKGLDRKFIQKRSPYVGVKYHLKTNVVENNSIELHNFKGGYCGISRVEKDIFNLCYLSHRDNLRKYGNVEEMEDVVLCKNPHLEKIFKESEFLFEKPNVINEITFEKKEPVYNHILMSGDSAGMIAPLCGNGMAIAIHSAKILSGLVIQFLQNSFTREQLESLYTKQWNELFSGRLAAGRKIQYLFGSGAGSETGVTLANIIPPIAKFLMKKTHGVPF